MFFDLLRANGKCKGDHPIYETTAAGYEALLLWPNSFFEASTHYPIEYMVMPIRTFRRTDYIADSDGRRNDPFSLCRHSRSRFLLGCFFEQQLWLS